MTHAPQTSPHTNLPDAGPQPTPDTGSTITLLQALRQVTQTHHKQAESTNLAKQLARGQVTENQWIALLNQLWHGHTKLDEQLAIAAKDDLLNNILSPNHMPQYMRRRIIENDLAKQDAKPNNIILEATTGFIQAIENASPFTILGVLYVIEGSTNGGRIIAQKHHLTGPSYFNPHCDLQATRWSNFAQQLSHLKLNQVQTHQCTQGAKTAFTWFIELYRAIDHMVQKP